MLLLEFITDVDYTWEWAIFAKEMGRNSSPLKNLLVIYNI